MRTSMNAMASTRVRLRTDPRTHEPVKGVAQEDEVPPLGRVLDFLRLLWGLDQGLQRQSKQMLRTVGVTGPQRLVIRIVGCFPGISAGRLARIIHLHPSTLSGVLDRLESRKFLERATDPWDGRRSMFRLTEKGRATDAQTEGTVEATVEAVLAGVPEEKLEAVSDVLGGLAAALGAERGKLTAERLRKPRRPTLPRRARASTLRGRKADSQPG